MSARITPIAIVPKDPIGAIPFLSHKTERRTPGPEASRWPASRAGRAPLYRFGRGDARGSPRAMACPLGTQPARARCGHSRLRQGGTRESPTVGRSGAPGTTWQGMRAKCFPTLHLHQQLRPPAPQSRCLHIYLLCFYLTRISCRAIVSAREREYAPCPSMQEGAEGACGCKQVCRGPRLCCPQPGYWWCAQEGHRGHRAMTFARGRGG